MAEVVQIQSVEIRQAQIHDLPEILGCLKQFFLESAWGVLQPEPDLVYMAEWLMRLDERSVLLLAVEDGKIIGLCGGTIVDFPLFRELPYLWEWACWVHPEHRLTHIASRLWREMTRWAKEHGARGCAHGKAEALTDKTIRQTSTWRWF